MGGRGAGARCARVAGWRRARVAGARSSGLRVGAWPVPRSSGGAQSTTRAQSTPTGGRESAMTGTRSASRGSAMTGTRSPCPSTTMGGRRPPGHSGITGPVTPSSSSTSSDGCSSPASVAPPPNRSARRVAMRACACASSAGSIFGLGRRMSRILAMALVPRSPSSRRLDARSPGARRTRGAVLLQTSSVLPTGPLSSSPGPFGWCGNAPRNGRGSPGRAQAPRAAFWPAFQARFCSW